MPKNWRTEALRYLGEDGELAQRNTQMRQELHSKLERAKHLYLLGDLTEREYLAERTVIQNALALYPTRLPEVEHSAHVLVPWKEAAKMWDELNARQTCVIYDEPADASTRLGAGLTGLKNRLEYVFRCIFK